MISIGKMGPDHASPGNKRPHTVPPRSNARTLFDALEAMHLLGDAKGFTFIQNDGSERYFGFRALVNEARKRGRQLQSLGLQKGDRVALVIPEADDFVLTFLGAVTAGIIPVPLYPPLSLGRLDAYLDGTVRVLNAAAVDFFITTGRVEKILWSVMSRVPSLRDLMTVEKLAACPESSAPPVEVSPRDPVFLQFTSGSTSAPKGVVVTHASLCANASAIVHDGLQIDPTIDLAVSWLPLYHDMGLIGFVLAPLFVGVPLVFIPTLSFVRRPTLWLEMLHKHRGTITFAPNFAFARVTKRASDADLARWDLSCVRVVGCGAEPIHPGTIRGFIERFSAGSKLSPKVMMPCYGMAEATLAMSFAPLGARPVIDVIDSELCYSERRAVPAPEGAAGPLELVSCGKPFPHHDLAIFSDDGERLPDRHIGEIWFRGPSVTSGYFRNPEASHAAFGGPHGDGWLRTGDLGYIAGGDVFISGRKKDILIIHGRNYYPQGIEWLVEEIPGIRKGNVVAFSIPGAASEEVVIAAETTEQDAEKRRELIARVKQHVNEEMALSVGDVKLVGPGELPKTSSGKLQRSKTREQFLAGTLGTEGVRSLGTAGERLSLARHMARSMVTRIGHMVKSRLGLLRPSGGANHSE